MIAPLRLGRFSVNAVFEPLRFVVFRRIWIAGLLSNVGVQIQGVGAAWAMTRMVESADKFALVQTAMMLPVMLISLPAGPVADLHDRRIVAIWSLAMACAGVSALAALDHLGRLTPDLLLALCFTVGTGMALMAPAWQSSVNEHVPPEALVPAVTLNVTSYNLARGIGPVLGGLVVASAGAAAAFALNAFLYLPLMAALFVWRRASEPSPLPRERLNRAMISGVRYIVNSPSVKVVLTRSAVIGVLGGAILALMPLVTRDLLHGGAESYGIMLGMFGLGVTVGTLSITQARNRMSAEAAIRVCSILMGAAFAVVAVSPYFLMTAIALVVAGAAWMMTWAVFNLAIQLSAPRWVSGRALAAYQAAASGEIAVGSWPWGHLTNAVGVEIALLIASALMLISPLLGHWLPMPQIAAGRDEAEMLADPEVRLSLSGRSGPLVVTIEYRVAESNAKSFHDLMQEVALFRRRNGAYGWSIARDIADPESWTERYHCPTWFDYLRQRNRSTQSERAVEQRAMALHIGPAPARIRRMLERPYGSLC